MSRNQPGVLFDASNSWNGYNHQGKLALYYAIEELTGLIDPEAADDVNKDKLSKHFLEIEHLEDFSVGRIENGELHYTSVHQVKDMVAQIASAYKSAIQGLAKHLIDDESIEEAFLHVTTKLRLSRDDFEKKVGKMIETFDYPGILIRQINDNRSDPDFRRQVLDKSKKELEELRDALRSALDPESTEPPELTEAELDKAFDLRLVELETLVKNRETLLGGTYKTKIKLFPYRIDGEDQEYCEEDQASELVRESIKGFYRKKFPGSYQSGREHVKNAYLYVMYQLDTHVVDRARNFQDYKTGIRDRHILYSELYDWLLAEEIGNPGEAFYLYKVREEFFRIMNGLCKYCRKEKGSCPDWDGECSPACRIHQFTDRFRDMGPEALKQFLYNTNPHVTRRINFDTVLRFLQEKDILDPFLKGLRQIGRPYSDDPERNAIVYRDDQRQQYALTALARMIHENIGEDVDISMKIMDNEKVHELLMDYRFLISKDVDVPSLLEACPSIALDYLEGEDPELEYEHILQIGKVGIIPIDRFISASKKEEPNES